MPDRIRKALFDNASDTLARPRAVIDPRIDLYIDRTEFVPQSDLAAHLGHGTDRCLLLLPRRHEHALCLFERVLELLHVTALDGLFAHHRARHDLRLHGSVQRARQLSCQFGDGAATRQRDHQLLIEVLQIHALRGPTLLLPGAKSRGQ